MTLIAVLWVGIALVVLAVIALAWLGTRHSVLSLPSPRASQVASSHDPSANDRTQPRRAAR